MADAGRDEVAGRVLSAWDAFIERAEAVDLDRPSRLESGPTVNVFKNKCKALVMKSV